MHDITNLVSILSLCQTRFIACNMSSFCKESNNSKIWTVLEKNAKESGGKFLCTNFAGDWQILLKTVYRDRSKENIVCFSGTTRTIMYIWMMIWTPKVIRIQSFFFFFSHISAIFVNSFLQVNDRVVEYLFSFSLYLTW